MKGLEKGIRATEAFSTKPQEMISNIVTTEKTILLKNYARLQEYQGSKGRFLIKLPQILDGFTDEPVDK